MNNDKNLLSLSLDELDDVTIEMINTYTEDKGKLKVKKSFAGAEALTAEEKAAISFTVSGPDGFTEQTRTYGEFTNGVWDLGEVPLGTYTVSEANAGKTGYTLVTTYKVDSAETTKAEATLAKDADVTIEMINTYKKSATKGEIAVQKVLKGRKWTDDDEFEFTLSADPGTPMPANTSIFITRDDKDQTKSFGEITFTKPGKYTYTVEEVEGDDDDITYDTKAHKVTIEIVDDGNGNLIAKKGTSAIKKVKITNTYKPEKTVKTGDDSNMIIYLAGMIAAMLGLIVMIFRRRTQRNQ